MFARDTHVIHLRMRCPYHNASWMTDRRSVRLTTPRRFRGGVVATTYSSVVRISRRSTTGNDLSPNDASHTITSPPSLVCATGYGTSLLPIGLANFVTRVPRGSVNDDMSRLFRAPIQQSCSASSQAVRGDPITCEHTGNGKMGAAVSAYVRLRDAVWPAKVPTRHRDTAIAHLLESTQTYSVAHFEDTCVYKRLISCGRYVICQPAHPCATLVPSWLEDATTNRANVYAALQRTLAENIK